MRKPEGRIVYENLRLCSCFDTENQTNSYCHPEARPGQCEIRFKAFTLPELAAMNATNLVDWSEEDGCYVGRLPLDVGAVTAHGATREECRKELMIALRLVLAARDEANELVGFARGFAAGKEASANLTEWWVDEIKSKLEAINCTVGRCFLMVWNALGSLLADIRAIPVPAGRTEAQIRREALEKFLEDYCDECDPKGKCNGSQPCTMRAAVLNYVELGKHALAGKE